MILKSSFFQAECYFDCESVPNQMFPGKRIIKDIACLEDCFTEGMGRECIRQGFNLYLENSPFSLKV